MKHVCFHLYNDIHLSNNKNVEARDERRGQGCLPMCKDCLNNAVPVAYKRGEANQLQAAKEKSKKNSVGQESRQIRKKMNHTAGL